MTMSAYVKVIAGTLSVGQEGATQDFTNSSWQKVNVTTNSPTLTLGGYWVFQASPTTFTDALIALPKVEQGATASPWIEGQDPTTAVSASCSPGWNFSVTSITGVTLCTVSLQVPWDAVLQASIVGHIRSTTDGHRCTVGISIDNDIPTNRDMCCDDATAALQPLLFHPSSDVGYVPGSTTRTKAVIAGTRVVRAWLNSTSANGCILNGSSLTVIAHRR